MVASGSMRPRYVPLARLLSILLSVVALAACGVKERLTPPSYAPLPARDADLEVSPARGRLPEDTHPLRYHLQLSVDPRKPTYTGEVQIELALDRPRERLWLHNRGPRVSQVRVVRPDGQVSSGELTRVSDSGLSALRLTQPVGPGSVRIELTFEANFGV